MAENAAKTRLEEPPRTRGRGRVAALVLALGVLVLAAPFANSTVQANVEVKWLAYRMRSEDRAVREEARHRLLEIGRPSIDEVFPEVVAGEVENAAFETPGSVFVAEVASRRKGTTEFRGIPYPCITHYMTEADLRDATAEVGRSWELPGLPASRNGMLLWREQARRVLVVFGKPTFRNLEKPTYIRLEVPLDDDPLAPAIIEAVKVQLQKEQWTTCPVCGARCLITNSKCPLCGGARRRP